ncbi:MAG TPA: hypothetical protein DDW85_08980 [Porphyromonadaceae bacterium]|jgi:hypothetical protein|nr:hypothetical protein [Porphyromonadaceae bacterium]
MEETNTFKDAPAKKMAFFTAKTSPESAKPESASVHIEVLTPGTLAELLPEERKKNMRALKITGILDVNDFSILAELSGIEILDISGISNITLPPALFKESRTIQRVYLPEGLTAIPDELFSHSSLSVCNIPSSVTIIGTSAFEGCEHLTGELVLPEKLTTISENAFDGCSHLSGPLVLPASLSTLGERAFAFCYGFTGDLHLPEGLTTIKVGVFANCSGLNGSIILPKSLSVIKHHAFRNCSELIGKLIFPAGLNTIEWAAFWGCKGLSGNLVFPRNLRTLGSCAFYDCTGIEKVYFQGNIPPLLNDDRINFSLVCIPKGAKKAYRSAHYWKHIPIVETEEIKA